MTNHSASGGSYEQLNLVPYLDIMINLVLFLLATTSMIVPMRAPPVLVPTNSPEPSASEFLTVAISNAGLTLMGSGPTAVRTDLPRDPVTRALPLDALTAALRTRRNAG